MMESLIQGLINLFTGLKISPKRVVFLVSMLPLIELRGGLIAASLLDINIFESVVLCFLGNIIPIPFILWFITPIFEKLKKTKLFAPIVMKLENKALSKREKLEKYEFWGLVLFVGVPIPGTGAWMGSLASVLLGMDKKKSLLAILIGLVMSSIIMLILSFGLLKAIV